MWKTLWREDNQEVFADAAGLSGHTCRVSKLLAPIRPPTPAATCSDCYPGDEGPLTTHSCLSLRGVIGQNQSLHGLNSYLDRKVFGRCANALGISHVRFGFVFDSATIKPP